MIGCVLNRCANSVGTLLWTIRFGERDKEFEEFFRILILKTFLETPSSAEHDRIENVCIVRVIRVDSKV